MSLLLALQCLVLIPVIGGVAYWLLSLAATLYFTRQRVALAPDDLCPPVTVLKPICGLEKELLTNLRSLCEQDYPQHQVVMSVQTPDDPALPLLRALEAEYGGERVSIVVSDAMTDGVSDGVAGANGKIFNLSGAIKAARYDMLVISDSDVRVGRDYLRAIVQPLEDPNVGYACTLYRAVCAERWYERLELLSLHDFTVNIVFAATTGASDFCLGSSIALRRESLEAIGGFEPLAEFLAEDFEMGRRIQAQGLRVALVPYLVETVVDLEDARAWWRHQVYWDQNTRLARPIGFFSTVVIRGVPFALLFAALRGFDPVSLAVLAGALVLRIATSAGVLALLRDREGLRNIGLLPLRDLAGLGIWLMALRARRVVWRGAEFDLTSDGRMAPADRG